MKTPPDSSGSDAATHFVVRLFHALFGKMHYEAPPWLAFLGRRWILLLSLACVLAASGVGVRWYLEWRELHRVRLDAETPRFDVVVSASKPGFAQFQKKSDGTLHRVVAPLEITFSRPSASLLRMGPHDDPPEGTVALSPSVPGKWRWASAQKLVFEPAEDWVPGTEYRVRLGEGLLAPEARPDRTEITWVSRPLKLIAKNMKFGVDVKEEVCRLSGRVQWSHPVSLEAMKAHAAMRLLTADDVGAGREGTPLPLEWTPGKTPCEFFFRSAPVEAADKDSLADLELAPELTPEQGGAPLGSVERLRLLVPNRFGLLHAQKAETRIVCDQASGEPRRLLFVELSSPVIPAEVDGQLELRLLTRERSESNGSGAAQWEKAAPLRLVSELTGDASRRPTNTLVYRYEGEPDQESSDLLLLLRVREGLPGLGGFKQQKDLYLSCSQESFPSSIEVAGNGCILQLEGERKIRVTTRNVRYLLVTLGRVPCAQVPGLLAYNWSDFSQPDLSGRYNAGDFRFGEVTHSVRRLVTLPAVASGKAVATEIDLGEYVARMPGSEGDCGVFVLKLEKAIPGGEVDELSQRACPEWDGCLELLPASAVDASDDEYEKSPQLFAPIKGSWRRFKKEVADQRLLLLTDLGLIAKKDARLRRDIWALSLHEGTPAANVEFSLVGRNGETIATSPGDEEGHAFFDYDAAMTGEHEPLFLLAKKGTDFSFLPANRIAAESWGRADVWGIAAADRHQLAAAVFTDRGIYRPGETVHVGFAVKREDWGASVAGLPVTVEMRNARGKTVESCDVKLGPEGLGEKSVELPISAPAGVYTACVREMYGRKYGSVQFRVGDFEPDRMKLSGRFEGGAPGAAWLAPEKATYVLHVQNLYGTPAAGRQAAATLLYGDEAVSFPGWEGWKFFAGGREGERIYEEKLGNSSTDDNGHARFVLPLGKFASATYSLCVRAEAFEPGSGRSVKAESKTIISPWPWLLASKPDGNPSWVPKGSPFAINWAAIDASLKPVSPEGLRVTVRKKAERVELSRSRSGDYFYDTVSYWGEPLGEPLQLAWEKGRARLPLQTGEVGTFRAQVHDKAGNLRGECTYTVVGEGGMAHADRSGEIRVQVPNKVYAPGDIVEVAIQAPFSGSGLVTLEREKVWASQTFQTTGTHAVVPVRIPDDAEGSLYATVCYLRASDSPEVFRCPFASATAPLRVEKASRSNAVTLRAPQRAESGGKLEVAYRAEKPCRVILYAVDEGILQYTHYRLPDLRKDLMKKRMLEVRTYEWLTLLLPEYRLLQPSSLFGGGDGDAVAAGFLNPFARQHEKSVVFWSGVVEAGPEEKTLSWQLPDYFSGTLRLMAVAVNEESLGTAEAKVLVQAPVILMPTAPAFVAPGDRFRLNLNVTNMLGGDTPARFSVVAEPSWARAGASPEERQLELAPGKDGNITWEMEAPLEPGACSVTFTAKAGGRTVTRKATLSVRPSSPYETRVTSGYFRTAEFLLKADRKLLDYRQKRAVSASVSPIALLDGLGVYMKNYPYDCTEQTTSRAIVAAVLGHATAPDSPWRGDAAAMRDRAEAILDDRQGLNGGFGMWSGGEEGDVDLNLHVAQYLVLTGETESPRAEQLASALERYVQDRGWNIRHARRTAEAIYLLARMEKNQHAALMALRDALEQDPNNPWKQNATGLYIAASYSLMQKKREAFELASACCEARKTAAQSGRLGRERCVYEGEADAEALKCIALTCRHFPKLAGSWGYADIEPMMEALKKDLFNTYDAAYVALAAYEYGNLLQRSGVMPVLWQKTPGGGWAALGTQSKGCVQGDVPAAVTDLKLVLDKKDTDLGAFFQLVEAGFEVAPCGEAVRSGIEVVRDYLDEQGNPARTWKLGQPVVVRLRLRNLTDRHMDNVAITDLLPGATQVAAGSLEAGPGRQPGVRYVDMREDRNLFFVELEAGRQLEISYRLKPLNPGNYVLPAVLAEHMYKRMFRARSGGGRVEVNP